VSGAIAERIRVSGYLIYCVVMSGIVYPLVAHWMWSGSGWLSPYNPDSILNLGAIDYAGDAAVHMIGGFSGIIGALCLGYRGQFAKDKEKYVSRFEKLKDGTWVVNDFPSNNDGFATLGVLMLWFSWYGFNSGSTGDIVGLNEATSRIAVNTTLSPSIAALVSIFLGRVVDRTGRWNLNDGLNGILAGLVAITGPCATVETWAAIIIGALSGFAFKFSQKLLLKLRIDDPLDAFPVHGACGVLGLLASGFFSTPEFTQDVYKRNITTDDYGVFYGGKGKQLACQIIAILVVGAWSCAWAFAVFGTMRLIDNRRRDKPWFTIREKFETLDFGGQNVAFDFLPPRKDIDLEEIGVNRKDEDDSSSSDSEQERLDQVQRSERLSIGGGSPPSTVMTGKKSADESKRTNSISIDKKPELNGSVRSDDKNSKNSKNDSKKEDSKKEEKKKEVKKKEESSSSSSDSEK